MDTASTRLLRVKDLIPYVESEAYRHSPVVAISPQRARAQAHNPRAQPDDPALLLVYEKGDLAAYLGAMPDIYHDATGQSVRMAWLTCMWVSPVLRGRGVALRMMHEMIGLYGEKVCVTGFVPETRVIYERLGYFEDWATPGGFRGYLRPDFAHILPPKGGIFAKIKTLLHGLDAVLDVFNSARLWFIPVPSETFHIIQAIGPEEAAFIQNHQDGERIRRDAEALNWILDFPWMEERRPELEYDARRYYFSVLADRFENIAFTLRSAEGHCTAVVVLALRDRHLKLVSAHSEEQAIPAVARVIYQLARQKKVATVTIFNERLSSYILMDKSAPFFHKRPMHKPYFVGKKLNVPATMFFQDGDGDAAFT